ncbi:hypothetical protein CRE_04161 [Caenorhabditis remanei]|uniref:Sdz-33 F-box domain-containing protein n=1 Tax=Caenorhabditis remanei TaxID=31234 RepID=E3MYR6_CAERE|nr:hypothetical protein CRE_04161 [Caenorhabditis remanei]
MTTPFRLFSLPFIPLKQVLDNFGPHGILILSLCSQRSKSIAVSYRGPSKDVKLQLTATYSNIYALANDFNDIWNAIDIKDFKNIELPTLSSGQFQGVQYKMHEDCLVTFWEDKLTGLLEIGKYAREIFNRDIYQIYVGGKDADRYKRLIEWTMDTQEYIKDFIYIENEHTHDQDLDYILENVKCSNLSLSAKPSENYRPAKPFVFNLCKLHILNSFWIKPEVLLGINSKIIKLEDSKLTSQDFNVFLKHWMTGGCSKLKLLHVSVEEAVNYETVFDGVEFIERGEDVERVLKIEGEHNISMIGGADIKGPGDNITATIKNHGENPKHFGMIVWPE